MALYHINKKGIILGLENQSIGYGRVVRRFDVEHIRNKPYGLYLNRLYWVDDNKLYYKNLKDTGVIIENDNLIGTRDILVFENELITITQDYTIGVFDLEDNVFKEYGSPNPELKLASLNNYKIIQPDQVFEIDGTTGFKEYKGQNMLLHSSTENCNLDTPYAEYNEYVHVRYETENMIDRNDKFMMYRKNNSLSIISYRYHDVIYDVPDDATLYNPEDDRMYVNVKSARSV